MKTFQVKRKPFMTLLETLIAVSLLSILLVFVFGFFRELSLLTRATELEQKKSFQMRYLESRLGFIFDRIVNENDSKRMFYFYTQPGNHEFSPAPSLILTFDNEVRQDPNFSGDVLGRLYVDNENRLCLATWPLIVEDPHSSMHEEVLMNQVVNVSYSFYAAPERVNDSKNITTKDQDPEKKTPPRDQWHKEWAMSYEQMPSMIKVEIEFSKEADLLQSNKNNKNASNPTEKILFHFVLPSSKNPVHYPPGEMKA